MAFGRAKFSPTGLGEQCASPASRVAKIFRNKTLGRKDFEISYVDEWNTSKVCHRCNQPLQKIRIENKNDSNYNNNNNSNGSNVVTAAEEGGGRVIGEGKGLRNLSIFKIRCLRGLMRCGSARKASTVSSSSPSSSSSPTSPVCPIGGLFVDRDANAAANIGLKVIRKDIRNLTQGVSVGRLKIFKLKNSKQCL